jgi:hypothetical protein
MGQYVNCLNKKETYYSLRREVLYIHIEIIITN